MKILVDFDNVVNLFQEHQLEALNREFGTAVTISECNEWGWSDSLPQSQYDFLWGPEVYQNYYWTLLIPENAGALYALEALHDGWGHTIHVVSDRPFRHQRWVQDWFAHRNVFWITVVVTDYPTMTKTQFVKGQRYKVAIEDSPYTALGLAQEGIYVLLMDRPWNRDVEGERILRVSNWVEASNMIHTLDKLERGKLK